MYMYMTVTHRYTGVHPEILVEDYKFVLITLGKVLLLERWKSSWDEH